MAKPIILRPSPFSQHLLFASQAMLLFQIISTALYFNPFFTNPLVNKYLMAQSTSLLAWLFYLLHCYFSRDFRFAHSPFYLPIAAFAAWAGFRSVTAPNDGALWNYYIFITILSSFPLWVTHFHSQWFRKIFTATVLFTGTCVLTGCILQLRYMLTTDNLIQENILNWDFIYLSTGSYERQRLGSTLGHNNHSSAYVIVCGLYVLYRLLHSKNLKWTAAYGLFLSFGLIAVVMGGSRSAALMIPPAFALLLYGFYRSRRNANPAARTTLTPKASKERSLLIGSFAVLGVLIALLLVISLSAGQSGLENVFKRFVTSKADLLSGTYPRVWLLSLFMLAQHPLTGVGFSAWSYKYPEAQEAWFGLHPDTFIGLPPIGHHTERAHNDYLNISAELGLPGVLLVAWLLILFVRCVYTLLRRSPVPLLGITAAAAVLAVLTQAVAAFPFYVTPNACLFMAGLALFSSVVDSRIKTWSPPILQNEHNTERWWLGGVTLVVYLFLSQPVLVNVQGDIFAQRRNIYNNFATYWWNEAHRNLQAGNQAEYESYKQYAEDHWADAPIFLEESVEILPDFGEQRYKYGVELVHTGINNSNTSTIQRGIDELNASLRSYGYYDTFTNLGLGYKALWKLNQEEDPFKKAEESFRRSASIMPTNFNGWIQLALLYAENDQHEQWQFELSNTELRFPGFIENAVLEAAYKAESEQNIEKAAMLYGMAATVKPGSEKVFESRYNDDGTLLSKGIIDFYLQSGRRDMAARMLSGLAEYQPGENVENATAKVLYELLTRNETAEAFDLMNKLRMLKNTQDQGAIWYYSGMTAWLAGDVTDCFVSFSRASELGVPAQRTAPALVPAADMIYFPFLAIGDTIKLTLTK